MENQHNKSFEVPLLSLRQEIDLIDNQIIELLAKRMQIIDRVADLKKSNNEKFFIRSNREADMIKELVARSDSKIPKNIIVSIWRKIISAANMHEQSLKIALHNPKNISDYYYLLREYYCDEISIESHDSTTNIVSEIEKGQALIGVFALPNSNDNQEKNDNDISENWWISLANNKSGIKAFAKIPFIESKNKADNEISLVAFAIKQAEQSKQDNSLIYLEVKKEFSRSQIVSALSDYGLKASILKSAKLSQVDDVIFYLVELEGFFTEEDQSLKNFSKSKVSPYLKVLGSYALPIKI